MLNPILATSYAGIELVFLVPAVALCALAGSACLLFRFRAGAIFFGIISFLVATLSFVFAFRSEAEVRHLDAALGCVGILIALFLLLLERKPKPIIP